MAIIFQYTGIAFNRSICWRKNQHQNPCDDPEEELQENQHDDNDDIESAEEYQEI